MLLAKSEEECPLVAEIEWSSSIFYPKLDYKQIGTLFIGNRKNNY
jgi:hypothetical protein